MDELETKLQLEKWRDQYQAIFLTEVADVEFIWRELTRAEYKKSFEYYSDPLDRNEYICRVCILDPIDVDFSENCPAGIPDSIAAEILAESGFAGSEKITSLMNQYDREMQSFDNQVSAVIAEAFPSINIEEIENWSMEKTLWHYSRAKWMLEVCRGVQLVPSESTAAPQQEAIPPHPAIAKMRAQQGR